MKTGNKRSVSVPREYKGAHDPAPKVVHYSWPVCKYISDYRIQKKAKVGSIIIIRQKQFPNKLSSETCGASVILPVERDVSGLPVVMSRD